MKFQVIELLFGKSTPKQMVPKVTLLAVFAILLFTVTPLSYPLFRYSSSSTSSPLKSNKQLSEKPSSAFDDLNESTSLPSTSIKKCDIFTGEWVPNPKAPYYTNNTCWAIHEHQNCMKYGRPDSEFMKWKWKPNGCDLPVFNPFQFLEIMRGKSMAFVGDSVGRNQMQSMICLLSRVEWPIDVSYKRDDYFMRWRYPSYNFTMAAFWTTHLVRSKEADAKGPGPTGLCNLYLDEPDEKWITQVEDFDYVILNGGHWFTRSMVFYEKQKIVGCHYCLQENVPDLTMYYGYRKAFRTAFRAINRLENFKGTVFLRTFAPSHFENGLWNEGGNCIRTKPFKSNETQLEGLNLEFYMIQLEEFKIAEKEAKKKGLKYRLFDITQASLLRPDGHPSRYGHWLNENVTLYNDCVHWCLPGPIDTWSDFLLGMLKMEGVSSAEERLHLHFFTSRVLLLTPILALPCRRLGWEPKPGESHVDAMLRGEILTALAMFGHNLTLDEASKRFLAFLENRNTPLLPPDIRKAAYVAVMQRASKSNRSDYESLLKVYRETDLSQEKTRILGSLASSRDPDLILEALNFMLSSEVRSQDAVFGLAVTQEGRNVAWAWLKENWEHLIKTYGSGFLITRFVSAVVSPFASFEKAKEVEEFFASHAMPFIARTLRQSLERVNINANWVQNVQNENRLGDAVKELAYRKY